MARTLFFILFTKTDTTTTTTTLKHRRQYEYSIRKSDNDVRASVRGRMRSFEGVKKRIRLRGWSRNIRATDGCRYRDMDIRSFIRANWQRVSKTNHLR